MVICLRHGTTDWNAEQQQTAGKETLHARKEILHGNNKTIDLNAAGKQAVHDAAVEMRTQFPHTIFVEVRSSPDYARDLTTRHIVAGTLNIPEKDDARLNPYNPGDLSGKPLTMVWDMLALLIELPAVAPPGGETMGAWLGDWSDYFQQTYVEYGGNDGHAVILVLHGMEFRALPLLTGEGSMEKQKEQNVKPGEFVVIH